MRLRTILVGIAMVAMAFIGATLAMQVLWPSAGGGRKPALSAVPPLPSVSRTSTIVAPTVIALSAIHEVLETATPRNLTGESAGVGVS